MLYINLNLLTNSTTINFNNHFSNIFFSKFQRYVFINYFLVEALKVEEIIINVFLIIYYLEMVLTNNQF